MVCVFPCRGEFVQRARPYIAVVQQVLASVHDLSVVGLTREPIASTGGNCLSAEQGGLAEALCWPSRAAACRRWVSMAMKESWMPLAGRSRSLMACR